MTTLRGNSIALDLENGGSGSMVATNLAHPSDPYLKVRESTAPKGRRPPPRPVLGAARRAPRLVSQGAEGERRIRDGLVQHGKRLLLSRQVREGRRVLRPSVGAEPDLSDRAV